MSIIEENEIRKQRFTTPYQPVLGIGSPLERFEFRFDNDNKIHLPMSMAELPIVASVVKTETLKGFVNLSFKKKSDADKGLIFDKIRKDVFKDRLRYDFEFWAATCAIIQDKEGEIIPFILNYPQRLLLKELEDMRLAEVPIRAILLKARQWGGSTLVQLYMAWMQVFVKMGWNAAVMTTVEDQAKHIRGMYSRMIDMHPQDILGAPITLTPYQKSSKLQKVASRRCLLGIGSYEEPENMRSFTYQMLHMSEVASWRETTLKKPEFFIQATRSSVPYTKDTMVVLESTAKGVGNFFHNEWLAAKTQRSGYKAVFIPWFYINEYQHKVEAPQQFIDSWSEYEQDLWAHGATIEGISWYRTFKNRENYSDWMMQEEYPSNDIEAFQSTGSRIFPFRFVAKLRAMCRPPEMIGELRGKAITGKDSLKAIAFYAEPHGNLWVWMPPDTSIKVSNRYALFVDIGGRTKKADYSVIRVIDRYWLTVGGKPEFVATWRGHIDHDILAWKAAQLATWYNTGLLAIENNSLDKENDGFGTFHTILDTIGDEYSNLFSNTDPDKIREGAPVKYGFHTNVQSKQMIINRLLAAMRDEEYTETDSRACDELDTFEERDRGKMGAQDGCKDDMVITTAGDVWLALEYMPLPKVLTGDEYVSKAKKIISEATI